MRTTKREIEEMGATLANMMNARNKHKKFYTYQFNYGWGLMKYYANGGCDYVICARGHTEKDYYKIYSALCAIGELC